MWPMRSKFEHGLIRRAKNMFVMNQPENEDDTMASIAIDGGFYAPINQFRLGELCALILAQAQSDGASCIQLYYNSERMVYTLDGHDYDMVPAPSPMNVELARALVKASRTSWGNPGTIDISFADNRVIFTVTHIHKENTDVPHDTSKYIEVTGFTTLARKPCGRNQKTNDA